MVEGTRGKNWLIVALLMCKRQKSESNLKKVDCCVQSGGDFVHPWRLVRVSTFGDCWGWRVVLQEKQTWYDVSPWGRQADEALAAQNDARSATQKASALAKTAKENKATLAARANKKKTVTTDGTGSTKGSKDPKKQRTRSGTKDDNGKIKEQFAPTDVPARQATFD
jgi:hypothetical protein